MANQQHVRAVAAVADTLTAIEDPRLRWRATVDTEATLAQELRGVRRSIALELKHDHHLTWREVGEVMGSVSAQRAEQISRGV